MKLLFISGQPYSPRNIVISKGLKENGVEVFECTNFSKSYLIRYPNILIKFLAKNYNFFDYIYLGFFSQPLVPVIKKFYEKRIIFDAFLSSYDTLCFDRKCIDPRSLIGKFFYFIDKHSCELSDAVILDTNAHIEYFRETFGLYSVDFHRVFVGADEELFYPRPLIEHGNNFNVFYYGSFLPLQGIDYIIKAAKLLEPYREIRFTVIGKGMESENVKKIVKALNVKNIDFIKWVPYEILPLEIGKSDLCLGGHFSNIDKSKRVISAKTFHFISMNKPVIIGDNVANKELFEHGNNAFLVEHANEHALAEAILTLKGNSQLREKIAKGGYSLFKKFCTTKELGAEVKRIIENT